jgi:hypothetical protein
LPIADFYYAPIAVSSNRSLAPKVINSTSSLCNLWVLCASAVVFSNKYVNHRDTEHTEKSGYTDF